MQEVRAYISLEQIVRNAHLVQNRAGVPLIAVIKDDAYGHGAAEVAHALEKTAAMYAVATVREGVALRMAGVTKEILVLTPALSREEALFCAAHGLIFTLSSPASLRVAAEGGAGYAIRAHIAVNTGMNRYGFRPNAVEAACREAKKRGMEVVGAYSHFYAAENETAREEQYALFCRAAETIVHRFPSAMLHLSATGGILAGSRYNFDAVRSGIALYGYLPQGFEGLPVRPAAKLYAAVAHRGKALGGGAGYLRAEKKYQGLYTLRMGYGDGYFRAGGMGVGNLCMDACVREGDAPFGREMRILRDISAYAKMHGTTPYEVLVRVLKGADKYYV